MYLALGCGVTVTPALAAQWVLLAAAEHCHDLRTRVQAAVARANFRLSIGARRKPVRT
jgi:hypothetical protein